MNQGNKNRGPAYICPVCNRRCMGGRGFFSHILAHKGDERVSGLKPRESDLSPYLATVQDLPITMTQVSAPPCPELRDLPSQFSSPSKKGGRPRLPAGVKGKYVRKQESVSPSVVPIHFCPSCGLDLESVTKAISLLKRMQS